MIKDLTFGEGGQAEIAFESSEGPGAGLEIGPLSFQAVVVGLLEERLDDAMTVFGDTDILQGTDVAPQAIGENLGLFHLWGMVQSHEEGIARGLRVAPRGEVMSEVDIVSGDIGQPEPSFVSPTLELSFIGEDAGFSAPFFGDDGEGSAFFSKEEGGLVTPSGDGVVGDVDAEDIVKSGDDSGSGHGTEEGEIESECDRGGREFHFAPVEHGVDFPSDESDLLGFEDGVEGVPSGEGDVDFVSTFPFPFGVVAIASETESVTQVFEDGHVGAAFGTDDFGIFADAWGSSRDELMAAGGVFATVSLGLGLRIATIAVDVSAAAGTTDIGRRVGSGRHDDLLSCKGVKGVRYRMILATSCHERSYEFNNPRLLR